MSLFSFLIGFGASIALLRLALVFTANQRTKWLLFGLFVLGGALFGARLAFVAAHSNFFSVRTGEILNFAAGGLWWPGAMAGGLLIVLGVGIARPRSFGKTLDKFSVMFLPVAISFWLASWSAGVAYGVRLVSSVWWGLPMLDITGVTAQRVPVQPAAALILLLLFGGIELAWRKNVTPGRRMGVLLLALSIHTLLFSFMRADPIQSWLGLRLDVWASILFVTIAILFLVTTFVVQSKKATIAVNEEDIL